MNDFSRLHRPSRIIIPPELFTARVARSGPSLESIAEALALDMEDRQNNLTSSPSVSPTPDSSALDHPEPRSPHPDATEPNPTQPGQTGSEASSPDTTKPGSLESEDTGSESSSSD